MYIQINDLNIYYQKLGQGKNLVILHGWGNDVSSFWGVAQELKTNFTLFLIDLPGFGRSDLPAKAFELKDYAEVVAQVIKKLKLSKPSLLGHSVGGRIAIKLASKDPNILEKLILEDSAGIKPKTTLKGRLLFLSAKLFNLLPNIWQIKTRLRAKFYGNSEYDYYKAGPLKETFKKIIGEDLTKDLPNIKTDTLLLWGENDPHPESSLQSGKKMYKLIPNSRIETIDAVGHFPHLENPKMFCYWVRNFLN